MQSTAVRTIRSVIWPVDARRAVRAYSRAGALCQLVRHRATGGHFDRVRLGRLLSHRKTSAPNHTAPPLVRFEYHRPEIGLAPVECVAKAQRQPDLHDRQIERDLP